MGVSVIDPVAMREIQFIPTGRGAHGLQVSRDSKSLYVSNRLEGSISVIDFATRTVVAKWHIPGGGSPDMLQLSPDGTQLWASGRYNRTVYVMSTVDGALLARIPVGSEDHGLTYFPNVGLHSLGLGTGLATVVGTVAGVIGASVAFGAFKVLKSAESTDTFSLDDMIGSTGRVSVGIPANHFGTVLISFAAAHNMTATADAGNAGGSVVKVVAIAGDNLVVAPASTVSTEGARSDA